MQFPDDELERAFEPLKNVDVKTLSSIAETFKKSKDRRKAAVGVFLDRINRYRSSAPKPKSDKPERSIPKTGMTDLTE